MAEALYRKYRPQIFEDVVGQEHIERTIKNAIEQDKVSHAYLFTGPRGTGKTTTARLLAKALLCEHGPTAEPDGTCEDCEMIAVGEHPDVYELDAASRTGVENVREEIIGRVSFAPTRGRYKVYIIDEVHMLSTAAFNALLKTLEEPPSHVVFILATTDPQKVPETIHSRCQRFDFRRISSESIVSRLGAICVAEDVEFEGEALDLIAHRAEGGMRNALTSLEQLIAFGEGKVTLEVAERMLGSLDMSDLAEIVRYVGTRDVAGCFRWTAEYVETGADLAQFTRDFAEHIRNMYVMTLAGADVALDVSESERREMAEELPLFGPERLSRLLSVLGDLSADLKTSTNPRLSFEIALTRMVRPDSDLTLAALAERVEALESGYSAVAHVVSAPAAAMAPGGVGAAGAGAQGVQPAGAPVAGGAQGDGGAAPVVAASAAVTPDAAAGAGSGANVSRETFVAGGAAAAGAGVAGAAGVGGAGAVSAVGADAAQAGGATAPGVQGGSTGACTDGVSRETLAGASAAAFDATGAGSTAGATGASVGAVGMANAGAAGAAAAPAASSAGGALPDALLQSLRNPAALQRMWQAVLSSLKKAKASYGVLFLNTKAVFDEASGTLLVEFPAENDFAFKTAQGAGVQDELSRAVAQACGVAMPFMMTKAGARPAAAMAAQVAQPSASGAQASAAQGFQTPAAQAAQSAASPAAGFASAAQPASVATAAGAAAGAGATVSAAAGAPASGAMPADPSAPRGHHGIDAMTGASTQPGAAERGYGVAYDEVPVDLYDEVPYDDSGYGAPAPASAAAEAAPWEDPAPATPSGSAAPTSPVSAAAPASASPAFVPPTAAASATPAASGGDAPAGEGPSAEDLNAMLAFGFGDGVGFTEV